MSVNRDSEYNFNKDRNKLITTISKWVAITGFIVLIAIVLNACSNNFNISEVKTLECRSGSLYEVTPQKVELVLLNSCDKGQILMKEE